MGFPNSCHYVIMVEIASCTDREASNSGNMFEDHEVASKEALAKAIAVKHGFVDEQVVTIRDVKSEAATAPGENFASVLKRIRVSFEVQGQVETDTIIGKFRPKGSTSTWWNKMMFFERESSFYQDLVPKLREVSRGTWNSPFPASFVAGNGFILMEDLREKGFKISDPKAGLNLPEMKLIMKRLAEFHAVGHHLVTTLGQDVFSNDFKVFWDASEQGAYLTRDEEVCSKISKIHLGLFQAALAQCDAQIDPKHLNTIKLGAKECVQRSGEVRKRKTGQFLVICHGDLWNNNILFNSDTQNDESLDLRFVDLQASALTRPSLDLCNLIYQNTTPDLRQNHLEEILGTYHEELLSSLRLLGHSNPDLYPHPTFMQDFNDFFVHGFMMGLINTQTVFADDVEKITKMYTHDNQGNQDEPGPSKDVNELKTTRINRVLSLCQEAISKNLFIT